MRDWCYHFLFICDRHFCLIGTYILVCVLLNVLNFSWFLFDVEIREKHQSQSGHCCKLNKNSKKHEN